MSADNLGDRMKRYEAATSFVLPRRTYTIIRVDGKSFHTLLKKSTKPFDYRFLDKMDSVTKEMCKSIQNVILAYTQSDEISLVLQDFKEHETEPWFGGTVQKMTSISASLATYHFNHEGYREMGLFDSRVYTIPSKTEVMNYFVWRQKDAIRNSVSMAAQAAFSHKFLQGKSTAQMKDLLSKEGSDWNYLPSRVRFGGTCFKRENGEERSRWELHESCTFQTAKGMFLDLQIPGLE